MDQQTDAARFIDLAADIVSAYVTNNSVQTSDLPTLIGAVHGALLSIASESVEKPVEAPTPAVSVKKSITPDHLISLEDGKRYKSLRRHLSTRGLTPEQYREKWGLPRDYPMVAPNYSKQRSELAKSAGLGQMRRKAAEAPPARPRQGPPDQEGCLITPRSIDREAARHGQLPCSRERPEFDGADGHRHLAAHGGG